MSILKREPQLCGGISNSFLKTPSIVKKKKRLQHGLFPGGNPAKFWRRPTGLDFGDLVIVREPVLYLWCGRRWKKPGKIYLIERPFFHTAAILKQYSRAMKLCKTWKKKHILKKDETIIWNH